MSFYSENNDESVTQIYLQPCQLFALHGEYKVITVLGSCIAVCLYDPILKIGGINHFMLPLWNGIELASPKYGNIAIEKLIEKLNSLGSKTSQLEAKIFGGANQVSTILNIGERNILVAKQLLSEHKIPIKAENVGGTKGRKIIFETSTGSVLMKFLNK